MAFDLPAMNNREEQLRDLCTFGAPSGYERPLSEHLMESLPEHCARQEIDAVGSLIRWFPCGKEGAKVLQLDAHLDEIGFIITGCEDGFLRFLTVGGVDPRMLPNREVRLLTDPPINGLVTCGINDDEDSAYDPGDLRIDTGLSEEELKKRVPVGTRGVYEESAFALGENRFCGKAMDDRSCYLLLLRALELAPPEKRAVDVVLVGSVSEETTGVGATVSTYAIDPDYCIACDVTFGTCPDCPEEVAFPMGGGPAIGVGSNMARWMTKLMIQCAKDLNLPYSIEVMSGSSGTNAVEMQVAREGYPTGIISLPERYMHTPVEVIDWRDFESSAAVLAEVICRLGREEDV